ncbi:ABC transporter substrate-binding protein [Pengzhenrongella frigida]|uniref:ABC transporter substrate-binding protein n=1 Tax=Pengzhenrongella frigida TaxID=1259133 RepID=A0A4Q5N1I0_9MICO|nr:ABC transporter substrate-binding protein [Cellulomonas sp. HLT2-17]RYV51939.1 ABC transporter substrate-binding protein [Cellulomonas sp. HLT2-17]
MLLSSRTGSSPGRRSLIVGAAGLAVSALLLTGCSSSSAETSTEGGSSAETLTIFNGSTGTITENFNPFSTTALQPTLGVLFESLYWYNLASEAEPTPLLAEGFEWNADGTALTIHTREGVKWSDGEAFSANDVAFTFNLVASTPALNTTGIAATAEATDDNTVVLTFTEPSFMQEPNVLGNRAIVPEHIWKDVADPVTEINSDPVGTGAFTVKSFSAQSYMLEANPSYWGGEPAVGDVRYIALDSADAASAALVAGDVDWMSAYLPGLDDIISGNPDLSYVNTPSMTTAIFTCANADAGCVGPQTDPAVRQAIYAALNRDQLNKLAGGGFAAAASPTILLPERDKKWIADDADLEVPSAPDTDAAGDLLDAAGWTLGSDGIRAKDGERLSMTIQTVTGWSDYISLNDAMTQQLAEVGIELKASQVSWNEWNDAEQSGKFQLSLDSIGLGASSNPYFTYDKWFNSANTAPVGENAIAGNTSRFSDAAVDAAIAVARSTDDEAVQAEQYALIEDVIVEQMPYIPIYLNSMLTEFNTSRVTGWPTGDDKYAIPASWKAWDNGIILKSIKPAN